MRDNNKAQKYLKVAPKKWGMTSYKLIDILCQQRQQKKETENSVNDFPLLRKLQRNGVGISLVICITLSIYILLIKCCYLCLSSSKFII